MKKEIIISFIFIFFLFTLFSHQLISLFYFLFLDRISDKLKFVEWLQSCKTFEKIPRQLLIDFTNKIIPKKYEKGEIRN